jgi:hypothetical protein
VIVTAYRYVKITAYINNETCQNSEYLSTFKMRNCTFGYGIKIISENRKDVPNLAQEEVRLRTA